MIMAGITKQMFGVWLMLSLYFWRLTGMHKVTNKHKSLDSRIWEAQKIISLYFMWCVLIIRCPINLRWNVKKDDAKLETGILF